MKLVLYIFLSFSLILFTCDQDSDPVSVEIETGHFILLTDSELSTISEANEVLNNAEHLYPRILEILGENRQPSRKITIRLEGDIANGDPYYDDRGIHLFRYSSQENGYQAALAHEMVHAFREDYYIEYDPWRWENYPYLDEGLAEYIAQLVDAGKTGFPLYGYDVFAVVGDLVLSDNWIPHNILRSQHDAVNQRCHIQAYTERSTWMQYIDETYGRDALLNLNYPLMAPTEEYFHNNLGASLDSIDAAWKQWIILKYNQTPGAELIATEFRNRTRWYEHCEY